MTGLLRQLASVDPTDFLDSGPQSTHSLLGTPGLMAALVLSLSIVALVVVKLLKIAFGIVAFVMVPSVVVILKA